jgi:putative transferase (TIGR04331 family)
VLGMELFPALLPHLRSMLLLSVPLMRYANEVAIKVLDATRPHAVCFFAMPGLSAKALAFQAQQRGIPVVSYQHGGSYGVQEVPYHDFAEFAYSDYFLTYGDGILPPENPVLPTRAQFISVGSTRIKSTLVKESVISKKREVFNVLWIAEVSRKNILSASLIVEDTTRYTLQRKSLEMLSRARNVNVIYRPFPVQLQVQATPRWIKQSGLSCIQLDSFTSITDSILASDLIICDSSSNTTWNEVLALGKPLIIYCDPKQIVLMDHFAKDLEQACYWCKSVSELLDVMNRLAKEPEAFLEEVRQFPVNEYLEKYVLHEHDSVERVISFLSAICAQTQNLPNMDTSNTSRTTLEERLNGEN